MNSTTWPDGTVSGRSRGLTGGKGDSLCIGGRPGEAGSDDGHPGNDVGGVGLLLTETKGEADGNGVVKIIPVRSL